MLAQSISSFLPRLGMTITGLALATACTTASATAIPLPVLNGGFEHVSSSTSTEFGTGPGGPYATVDNWTTSGYNFIFKPGTADTTGSFGQYGTLTLWGPANGSANGLPASSPLGGNYVAADGAYEVQSIDQVINGLVIGQQYSLGFYYAGAQQHGYTGATTEQWVVSLGSETYSTPVLQNLDHGFTGWRHQDVTFTATSAQETLSFLAVGTPDGEPPFSLLDGVGMATTPEPGSFALLLTGAVAVGGLVRRRSLKGAV